MAQAGRAAGKGQKPDRGLAPKERRPWTHNAWPALEGAENWVKKAVEMPVKKCDNGKWQIGNGPCMYKTKAAADKAYAGYKAKKRGKKKKQ